MAEPSEQLGEYRRATKHDITWAIEVAAYALRGVGVDATPEATILLARLTLDQLYDRL